MIDFKSFLTEGRDAPLYHATSYKGLQGILKTGSLTPSTLHLSDKLLGVKPNYKKHPEIPLVGGISATRLPLFASSWKKRQIVIQLDQAALSHAYKIVPMQFWQSKEQLSARSGLQYGNEYEEFIVSAKNIPIKYINRIFVNSELDDYQSMVQYIQRKYAIPIIPISFSEWKGTFKSRTDQ